MKSDRLKKTIVTENLYNHDLNLQSGNDIRIIGIDEAGRGPLAGPVVAAAVCLDLKMPIDGINDSKKLSEKERETLYRQITETAVGWAVGSASHEEVDSLNVLNATFCAMNRAVLQLIGVAWDIALVDGNRMIPHLPADRQKTIIGGDACSASIAAASILAKVTRDRIMMQYHDQFPEYGFDRHKGYGTRIHADRINHYGLSSIHRKSFCRQLLLQTELFSTIME
jgi:ribonuclease HII